MGNKKDAVWIVELFTSKTKNKRLKVYELNTIKEIAYIFNMKPSTISNYYHSLIRPRGALQYANIYQRKINL